MNAFSEAIQAASAFLAASVSTETGHSVVQLLHNAIPESATAAKPNSTQRSKVVLYSLSLLRAIYTAALTEKRQLGVKDSRQINALIEVILILGLYKSLTPGVGVPETRRIKSILLIEDRQQEILPEGERVSLLDSIISQFTAIIEAGGELGQNLQRRHLIDVLSGLIELSFNPSIPTPQRHVWKVKYEKFVSTYFTFICCANFCLSLASILASFTAMLHPRTPAWVREPLTRKLSSIPLQEDVRGVRQIVLFLLLKHKEVMTTQLNHIGKVIGSIPSWITPEAYIGQVATQITDLLDDDDPSLQTAGVYIVSLMFAQHSDLVTRYILNPLREPLLTPINHALPDSTETISSGNPIDKALRRLGLIISIPLPNLILASVRPLLLNLFLLGAYAATTPHSADYEQVSRILQSYMAVTSSSTEDATYLIDRILYTSLTDGWTYAAGSTGGISIRGAVKDERIRPDEIQARVQLVLESLDKVSSDVKSEVFVGIMRRWLSPINDDSPMNAFAIVHLLQECLTRFESDLSKAPLSIIQVCEEILSSFVVKQAKMRPIVPSISNLGHIVQDSFNDDLDGEEFVDLTLDLLTTITAESIEREISQQEKSALESCLASLELIINKDKGTTRRNKAKKTASLVRARIAFAEPQTNSLPKSDEDIYLQAMEYISDPLVPVRAQGLSILRDLLLRRSPALDHDTILEKFTELLKDEDSYVYLNAIKSIQLLAGIDAQRFIRKCMDQYEVRTDVDERVRLAEALTGMILQQGEMFTGDFAQEIIARGVRLVSVERDWKVRTSGVGLVGVCCEIAPALARPAIEMALHLFRVNDLSFGEEGEGAAPLRRGAVTVIAGILRGGGIDALGDFTKDVLRSIKYLARSDGDETVRELAAGVMNMLNGVIEVDAPGTRWNAGRKIQEL